MTVTALAASLSASSSSASQDAQTGVLAFLIVAAIGVALVFLLRSMNKQFRKIGPGDDDLPGTAATTAAEDSSPRRS